MGLGGGVGAGLNIFDKSLGTDSRLPQTTLPVAWEPDWSYGNKDKFGTGDYIEALFGVKGQGKQALINRRQNVLDWLKVNQDKLGDANKEGKAGGLYDRIASGNIESRWLRNPLGTSGETGGRTQFGTADYLHAIASGKSNQDILDWVDDSANAVKWGTGNAPGGMGLHTTIKDRARMEGNEQQRIDDIIGLEEGLTGAAESFRDQYRSDMKSHLDPLAATLEEFQANQKEYERQQSAWQQRQTEATQQMQIQQMKALREKPVMQIMPAGGGGGMSAGSLAKKKKQVTGLNIK
mgnify:FL=1